MVSAQVAERPADRLSRHLRALSSNPADLDALIGAGNASIEVGDGNAALGFFARADERAPRNGQVKAGLARALLMVDNPREALKMFDAARSLGVPDLQLAPDRGLAYDLRGDNRRAQQDYALVLSRGVNDEVTKRYALSLGITGERDRALQLLDPLLYKRDQGAWRARAFVLALTGDTAGANKIVRQVMPDRMAQTMEPFLARLSGLTPAQKAAAVHLGEMPSNLRFAASNPPPPPQPMASAPVAAATPDARDPRRRPGARTLLASPPPERVVRTTATPTPTPSPTPTPTPTQIAPAPQPTPTQARPASASPAPLASNQRGDLDAIIGEIRAAAAAPAPRATPTPTPTRVAQATKAAPPQPRPTPTPTPAARKPEPAKADAAKPGATNAKTAAADAKKKPAPPQHPARIWVQVAGGANASALPKEWARLTDQAAEIKGKGPWTAKNRATNRLLAGPYKNTDEAQGVVSRLRKAGIGAFQWSSNEGEAVEKIGGK